jgi:hypothetical protein
MSTIPLSMREGHGQTLSGSDATFAAAHTDDDSKLDELIESATEFIVSRDTLGSAADEVLLDEPVSDGDSWRDVKAKLDDPETEAKRGPTSELDRALKVAVDHRASQETESADFRQSREWRDELSRRYHGRIAIGDLLDTFADWHERLKRHPRAAADAIAAVYLEQAAYALPDDVGTPNELGRPASVDGESADQKLNGILTAAIDRHHGKGDGEQATFAASARHRAALKEMFPGMTYAEACRRVVKLDRDLHRDPIGTAARLAATYRMPVTAAQQVVGEQRIAVANDAQQMIVATTEHLPELGNLQDDVIAVLERPEFMHGPDMQQNLLRAHHVAQVARRERQHSRERVAATPPVESAGLDGLIAQAMQRGAMA